MDPLAAAGLAVGAIGTALSIAVALRSRQLNRPVLSIVVGPPPPKGSLSGTDQRVQFGALVLGTPSEASPRLFACPFVIKNESSLPVSDLVLRLEYPASCLADNRSFPQPDKGKVAILRTRPEREVFEMSGVAYVSIELGLLRPGDRMATGELFALTPFSARSEGPDSYYFEIFQRVQRRYGHIPSFAALIPISLHLRAGNIRPSTVAFSILWLRAESLQEVAATVGPIVQAAWEGHWPKLGLYLRPRWKRFWRRERFTLLYSDNERASTSADPKRLFEDAMLSAGAVGAYNIPPWGLGGESFNLQQAAGVLIWPRQPKDR